MTSDAAYTPIAEVEITSDLVRSLLDEQHPDLADMSVQIMESGWDNVMVRIGEELALRLPRRAIADSLILNEQKWLPRLGPKLSVPIPVPIRVGLRWSWFPVQFFGLAKVYPLLLIRPLFSILFDFHMPRLVFSCQGLSGAADDYRSASSRRSRAGLRSRPRCPANRPLHI